MGKLFDEGYIRQLMFVGSAIYIFSLVDSLAFPQETFLHSHETRYFMLSLAKPHQFYQVFLAQGVGVGTAMGILYIPSISICFHYFKRRRGLAAGVASLGVSCRVLLCNFTILYPCRRGYRRNSTDHRIEPPDQWAGWICMGS